MNGDAGTGDVGTRGREDLEPLDVWTRGLGDAGTRGRGDAGTQGLGGSGARELGDSGSRALGDSGTRECGDAFSKYRISEMGEHPNVKRKLNCLWCFAITIIRMLFKYKLDTHLDLKTGFSKSTSRHPSQSLTVKQSRRPNGPFH